MWGDKDFFQGMEEKEIVLEDPIEEEMMLPIDWFNWTLAFGVASFFLGFLF